MDKFTLHFLVALLCLAESEDRVGSHGIEDFDPDLLEELKADCAKFQQENAELLKGLDPEQCGHDFALTRNHEGAGFWDRGLGEVGKKLTDAAHAYGQIDLHLQDDKIIAM